MQASSKTQKQQNAKNTKSLASGADLASMLDAIAPGTPEATDLPAVRLEAGSDDAAAFASMPPGSPVFTILETQEEAAVPPREAKEEQVAAVPPVAPARSKSMASAASVARSKLALKSKNAAVAAAAAPAPAASVAEEAPPVAADPNLPTEDELKHAAAERVEYNASVQKKSGKKPKTVTTSMDPAPPAAKASKKKPAAKKPIKSILKKTHFAPVEGNDGEYVPESAAEDEDAEGGVEGFGSEDDNETVAIQDLVEDPAQEAFDEQLTTSVKSKKNSKAAAAAAPRKPSKAPAPVEPAAKSAPVRVQGEPSGTSTGGKGAKRKASAADEAKSKPAAAAAVEVDNNNEDEFEEACDVDAILANPRNSRVCNIVAIDGQPLTTRNACKYANGCTYTLVQDREYEPCKYSNEDLAKPSTSKYSRILMDNFLHFELQGKPQKPSQPKVLSFFIDSEGQLLTCSRPMLMKLFYNEFGRDYTLMRKRYLDWTKRGNTDAKQNPYRVPPVFFTAKDLANKSDKDFPKLDTLEGYVNKTRAASKRRRVDTNSVAATSVAGGDDDDDESAVAEDDDDNASAVAPSVRRRNKAAAAAPAAKRAKAAAAAPAAVEAEPEVQLTRSRLPLPNMVGALPSVPAIFTTFDVNAKPLRDLKLHTRAMGPGSQLLMGMFLGLPIARLVQELGDMCRTELDSVIIADIVNRRRITVEATRRRLENELNAAPAAAAPVVPDVGPIPLRGAQVDDQDTEDNDHDDEEEEDQA